MTLAKFKLKPMKNLIQKAIYQVILFTIVFNGYGQSIKSLKKEFNLKAQTIEKLEGTDYSWVTTKDYKKHLYSNSENKIYSKGLDDESTIILDEKNNWIVLYSKCCYDTAPTTRWTSTQIAKSKYDSISYVGWQKVIGYNSKGLSIFSVENPNNSEIIPNAVEVLHSKKDNEPWQSMSSIQSFDFGKFIVKCIDKSNKTYYTIIDIEDYNKQNKKLSEGETWSGGNTKYSSPNFDKILAFSNGDYIAGILNDKKVIYDTQNSKVVDEGYTATYVSDCDFILVIKDNSIGFSTNDGWKTENIHPIKAVELGHCESDKTILIAKNGSKYSLDFWEGTLTEL
ncbi:hypothetical protein [Sediminitomix flava]|nr:hypothetical protein [Sediminitomix flava]